MFYTKLIYEPYDRTIRDVDDGLAILIPFPTLLDVLNYLADKYRGAMPEPVIVIGLIKAKNAHGAARENALQRRCPNAPYIVIRSSLRPLPEIFLIR